MALAFVNSTSGASGTGSVVLTLSVTAGNTIIAGGGSTSLANTITISDGVNTYTQVEAAFSDSGSKTTQHTFTATAATTATLTITVSFTNSANWQGAWAFQFSGGAASPVDKTADATNTATTAVVTGTTATTSQAGEALIGIFFHNTGSTVSANFSSAGSGYTLQETTHAGSSNALGFGVIYQIVSATGAYQASATAGTTGTGSGVIVTLKDSSGGGGGFTAKFRKTLSPMGTGVGKRQLHDYSH